MTLEKTLLDPTWTDPRLLEHEYGVGKVTAKIWWHSILLDEDVSIEREICFSWGTTINGVEAFCENPKVVRASDQDFDIKEAIERELGFRIDHLNYTN